MAQGKQLQAFISPVGEAVFPYLIVPDTRFQPDGVYTVDLSVPMDIAEPFIEKLENALGAFFNQELNSVQQKTLTKKPVFREEWSRPVYPEGATEEEKADIKLNHVPELTGNVLFKMKMNAKFTKRNGEIVEQQPIVVLADTGERVTENVWGGSIIRVKGQIVPYVNAAAQQAGLSLRLKTAQVIELVTGGSAGGAGFWTDFDAEDAA